MAKQSAPLDPHKQFIKIIESIAYNKHMGDRFGDFIEMAYCALAKPMVIGGGEDADRLEERYMAVVKRHKPEDIQRMPELLALTVAAVSEGGCDFLGKVASELSVLNSQMGQFFTPYELCRLNAEMIMGDVGETIARQGFVTVGEPACGSGAMILAAADVIERAGHHPATSMFVEANDLSDIAYKMAYVQLSARGIPAHVRRMNSLSLEFFEGAYTTAMPRFLEVHGEAFREWRQGAQIATATGQTPNSAPEPRIADIIAPPRTSAPEQLSMF